MSNAADAARRIPMEEGSGVAVVVTEKPASVRLSNVPSSAPPRSV
jgi:hypothetical protein